MIDARIRDAYETPDGVVIELEPRRVPWGWSCTGQRVITIRHATWLPSWGLSVTGDVGKLTIGSHPPHIYKQVDSSIFEEV